MTTTNKRKVVIALLTCSIMLTLLIGGTLAFLIDKEGVTNNFKVGKVDVILDEEFEPDKAVLFPTTGRDEDGIPTNYLSKRINVGLNPDSEDAYVRVHIAIPQVLDDKNEANYNLLHFNFSNESVAAGLWNWYKKGTNTWNVYEKEFKNAKGEDVKYNVYVVTYQTKLTNDDEELATTKHPAIHSVYLDGKTTQEKINEINTQYGSDIWNMKVAVEGCQANGFKDAYTALDQCFGVPGKYEADFTQTTTPHGPKTETSGE